MTQLSTRVTWLPAKCAGELTSDLAATVQLDGEAWRSRGAVFAEIDDGHGETVRSAAGICATSAGKIAFRVWDYGDEPITYLLVGSDLAERPELTSLLVAQMRRGGALDSDTEVTLFADNGGSVDPEAATLDELFTRELEAWALGHKLQLRRHPRQRRRGWRRSIGQLIAFDLLVVPVALVISVAISITDMLGNSQSSTAIGVISSVFGGATIIVITFLLAQLLRVSAVRSLLLQRDRPHKRALSDETQNKPRHIS